jgi:hypothetical protein
MIDDRPMPTSSKSFLVEPLRANLAMLTSASASITGCCHNRGIAPRIRPRWINTLSGLPIAFAAVLCLIAVAQSLRDIPGVEVFIDQHPGIAQARRPSIQGSRGGCSFSTS